MGSRPALDYVPTPSHGNVHSVRTDVYGAALRALACLFYSSWFYRGIEEEAHQLFAWHIELWLLLFFLIVLDYTGIN